MKCKCGWEGSLAELRPELLGRKRFRIERKCPSCNWIHARIHGSQRAIPNVYKNLRKHYLEARLGMLKTKASTLRRKLDSKEKDLALIEELARTKGEIEGLQATQYL